MADGVPPIEIPGQDPESSAIVARRIDHAATGRLDPPRRCDECGAKLTVQVFPHGYESHCTPCARRERFAAASRR